MNSSLLTINDYENILRFICLMQEEQGDYRYKLLKNISDIFKFDHLTFLFFGPDGRFTNPLGLNISSKLFLMYNEHYYKKDIFSPLNAGQSIMNKKTITITDIMPLQQYEETEYYKDFLKKDNLYYEIAMPLMFNNQMIGGIGVFRPKEEDNFTQRDYEILTILSDNISFQLHEYLAKNQIKHEQQIYKTCISMLPMGIIVLDNNKNIINSNENAKIFCLDILNNNFLTDPIHEVVQNILSNISFQSLDYSSAIYYELENYTIKIVPSIVPSIQSGMDTNYILHITKRAHAKNQNLYDFAFRYNLTERQIEIVELLSRGFSNKEIASKLYISTNTVRTHLDNIFNKLNVSNRTAVLYQLGLIDTPPNNDIYKGSVKTNRQTAD